MDTLQLAPISPSDAARLRAAGGIAYVAEEFPGYPCRQCLRDAEIGDELLLVSHDPFAASATASPYRSASPIFIHRYDCGSPDSRHELPDQITRRQLSVRAFDADALMIDAATIAGVDLDATLHRFLGDGATHDIHVHFLPRGCWAVTVQRPS